MDPSEGEISAADFHDGAISKNKSCENWATIERIACESAEQRSVEEQQKSVKDSEVEEPFETVLIER